MAADHGVFESQKFREEEMMQHTLTSDPEGAET